MPPRADRLRIEIRSLRQVSLKRSVGRRGVSLASVAAWLATTIGRKYHAVLFYVSTYLLVCVLLSCSRVSVADLLCPKLPIAAGADAANPLVKHVKRY